MPISYEAPEPFLPAVSYGYGETVQNNEDAARLQQQRQFNAQQQMRAAEMAQQHLQFGTQLAATQQARNAELNQNDRQFAAQQHARNNESILSAQVAARGRGGDGGQGDIQDAINHRDDSANRNYQFAAAQGDAGNRFSAEQVQAKTELENRFRLQAELQQTELTQQENMRLQRMKNAVGEVASDSTLSAEEKADFITQLKTGISPLEHRLAKARLAAETQAKEALADQRRTQAAADMVAIKFHSLAAEDRQGFVADPVQLERITKDLRENMPQASLIPPEVITKMAKQIALEQGLGVTMYQESPGKMVPIQGGKSGSGKSSAEASTHPTGLDADSYMKQWDLVSKSVAKDAAEKNNSGEPLHPELQTEEGRQKRISERLRSAEEAMRSFNAQSKPPEKKGYVSPWNRPEPPQQLDWWGRPVTPGQQAVRGPQGQEGPNPNTADDKPFDLLKPESQTPNQRAAVASLQQVREKLVSIPDGPERVKANDLWREAAQMLAEAGNVREMKPAPKIHYLTILSHLDAITKPRPNGRNASPTVEAARQSTGLSNPGRRFPGEN